MSTASYIDPKKLQELVTNAGELGVKFKDIKKLIGVKNVGIDPSNFKSLIEKYPEQDIPKNGDAIYHGGYPLFDKDGNYRVITIQKKTKDGIKNIEKIETTEPKFTLRFRLLKNNEVVIGWSVPRQDSYDRDCDSFSRSAGRNYSHLQLLRNCNDIFGKFLLCNYVNFLDLKNDLPIAVFANLNFYIDKFVRYSKIDVNTTNFYVRDIIDSVNCFKGSDLKDLPIQYVSKRFYKKFTK